jgi:hypothetical protein
MKGIMGGAAWIVLPLVLSGCLEIRQDNTLNPDGSGKAVFEMAAPAMPMMGMGGEEKGAKPDPDLMLKSFAKGTLDNAKGVETWSDVSFTLGDEGLMKFKGTAYFKDITKLELGGNNDKGGDGPTWAKDPKGGMALTLTMKKKASPAATATSEAKPLAMTDEDLAKQVKLARMQWQQMKPMMAMMMGKMKMEMIFRLPGTLAEVEGFKKDADGSVRVGFEGAKLMEAMDAMMADEAYLKASIKAGKDPVQDKNEEILMEKMFGTKGPMKARVTGDLKPAFDFEKEVKAAKEAYPKMIEKLGLDKVPAGGGMMGMPGFGMEGAAPTLPAPSAPPAPKTGPAPAAK